MAVEPGYIARQIFITWVEESPVVFIHSRSTIKDGNFQRGIICGFHVARKTYLFGVFEGCICQDPRSLVQWSPLHSEVNKKPGANLVLNFARIRCSITNDMGKIPFGLFNWK